MDMSNLKTRWEPMIQYEGGLYVSICMGDL